MSHALWVCMALQLAVARASQEEAQQQAKLPPQASATSQGADSGRIRYHRDRPLETFKYQIYDVARGSTAGPSMTRVVACAIEIPVLQAQRSHREAGR